ncbi:MAG: tetratricopeptide repeat protein [Bacteroidota bacterium]|nr:tetratricopeptide repeat protein [Bacteroidota bacterium]
MKTLFRSLSVITCFILFIFSACQPNEAAHGTDDTQINDTANKTDYEKRLISLNQQIESRPGDADLYFQRSAYHLVMQNYQLAARDIGEAVSLDTTNAEYLYRQGIINEKLPYVKGAIRSFTKAVQYDPKYTEAFLHLGQNYFYVKEYDSANRALMKAIDFDPLRHEAYYFRGLVLKESGKRDLAAASFQRAVEIYPQYFEAYLQLGELYAAKKDRRAASYYSNALRISPGSLQALYGRGKFYQDVDSFDRAIADYSEILRVDSSYLTTSYNIGFIYFKQKEFEKAIDYFSRSIETDPEHSEAYYGRALSYEALGQKIQAEEDFFRAEEMHAE